MEGHSKKAHSKSFKFTYIIYFSAFFNNITYVSPKVPTLYTVMSTGNLSQDHRVYGEYSHSFVLDRMKTIEIILNNLGMFVLSNLKYCL